VAYEYTAQSVRFAKRFIRETPGVLSWDISYPSCVRTGYPQNDLVRGTYYQSRIESDLAAIFLHGWRAEVTEPWHVFAHHLADSGVDTLFLELPFHLRRTPEGAESGDLMVQVDPAPTLRAFEQAVADIRTGVIWLHEGGHQRIGIVGVSLGAMVSTIAMGLEPRIQGGVLILGGADLEIIVWRSAATRALRAAHVTAGITHETCLRQRAEYPLFLEQVLQRGTIDGLKPPVKCYLFDPLTFAPLVRDRPVLMINGLLDPFVPRRATLALWNAAGRPRMKWIFSGHLTSLFWLPQIRADTISYLKMRIGSKRGERFG
jgi:pimeloyl-ACP methyl ester carboxylesterase